MTERPIAFAAPMVRAVLAGRKTQTRRLITPQPARAPVRGDACPYGWPGERLWVRERFAYKRQLVDRDAPATGELVYAADLDNGPAPDHGRRAWRPSRYMPRRASRIILEVIGYRAERVQRISRDDAIAEGFDPSGRLFDDPVAWFRELWDQLNADAGLGWDENPWVWVIQFKLLNPAPSRRPRAAEIAPPT